MLVWLSEMWHPLAAEDMETKKDVSFETKLYVLFPKAMSAGELIFSSAIKGALIAAVIQLVTGVVSQSQCSSDWKVTPECGKETQQTSSLKMKRTGKL